MSDLFAARSQMAISLAFHIIFAAIGMAMPFLMVVSHGLWIKTRKKVYETLTEAWIKGVAILFATGAVSGTVLSFELGLLWPEFMKYAGAIIGMPFSWEGTAFFLEAIAIGLFIYGKNRIPEKVRWVCGLMVGVSGVLSGIFVIAANSWMNSPSGFDWVNGQAINIDPVKAMFNDAWFSQALHMTIAAFEATGFAVAGVHAILLLRNPKSDLHKKAIVIALIFGGIAAIIQPISGDISAKFVAKSQPAKFAAMESHFETGNRVPLLLGGIPDVENRTVSHAIKIPGMLSFLAHGDMNSTVTGLEEIPRENWPPVTVTHISFQVMVACGVILLVVGVLSLVFIGFRMNKLFHPFMLTVLGICTPLGFIAIEAGWMVTEVGRQPWIIQGIMKTKDAVTPMPGLIIPFMLVTAIYILLSIMVTVLMVRQFRTVGDVTEETGGSDDH